MGVNNKQRRAAKRQKRTTRRGPGPAGAGPWSPFEPEVGLFEARLLLVGILREIETDPSLAASAAAVLVRPDAPLPPPLIREALRELLAELVSAVVAGGWRPSDLVEITHRRLTRRFVALLAGLLSAEADRHPVGRVAPAWREDLAAMGAAEPLQLDDAADVEFGLRLAAVLATLPPVAVLLPAPGTADQSFRGPRGADPKLLARVRALLAKAESTEFEQEAEALSAKAQELISRHALDRLLAHTPDQPGAPPTTARRLWIDAPYVLAKGMLIANVAEANRCRAVLSEQLGFATVVGDEGDLAAVDLLVTSLLVQADAAMLRCGRQADRSGTSRTRSFRQSFLVAYAGRVGERLQEATADARASTGRSAELVPVLRQHAEQVQAACDEMFPHLVSRGARIGNARGWAAGRAAADLALLDTDLKITQAAS